MGFEKVILGRTGLKVTRLGIGSSYGVDESMVEVAMESGVNYFYWGAVHTRQMANGIRKAAKNKRENMVVVVHMGNIFNNAKDRRSCSQACTRPAG